jgi:hypothetical protein
VARCSNGGQVIIRCLPTKRKVARKKFLEGSHSNTGVSMRHNWRDNAFFSVLFNATFQCDGIVRDCLGHVLCDTPLMYSS